MKFNLLYFFYIPLIASLFFGCSNEKGENGPRIFKRSENKVYEMKDLGADSYVDVDKDGRPDYKWVYYDFNRNGFMDGIALYKMLRDSSGNISTPSDFACRLGEDFNEDYHIDVFYIDKDNNGTLERKINNNWPINKPKIKKT